MSLLVSINNNLRNVTSCSKDVNNISNPEAIEKRVRLSCCFRRDIGRRRAAAARQLNKHER